MKNEWKIVYTKQGLKDKNHAFTAGFKDRIIFLLEILRRDPFSKYPPYEKLIGELIGAYSRRINHQHRLVYVVYIQEKIVKIISMWEHYS
jgi:Txe/YoeB family toxin of toxin-antitoxin system